MGTPSPIDDQVLRERLSELSVASQCDSATLAGLESFIRSSDDYELFRVNPLQYAKTAGLAAAETIDLFIHAAKVGLFEMDWQILCAYCPQVAGSFRELDKVHGRFQCEFCNAENDVALDDYIQVTFTLSDKIRDNAFLHPEDLPIEDYYLRYHFAKGFIPPGGMTHEQIVALLSREFADVEGGDTRTFEFDLPAGRFEILDLSHNLLLVMFIDGEPAGAQSTEVALDDGRFRVSNRPLAPREMVLGEGMFSFRNVTDSPPGPHRIEVRNRMKERTRIWIIQYPPGFTPHRVEYEPFLSGKRLLITPLFRELYKTELINEAEGLNINDLTYLFTDLKGSTPLYDAVGDVNAYFMVRQHFEILNKAVADHSGIIVKTIGDAIMAAFEYPADAVRAGVAMVELLGEFNRTVSPPLGLKVGVHKGRSIAVALNDRVDYFGQDVNMAARVQGLADGNELCITEEVLEASGVRDVLDGRPIVPEYVSLRGVGDKVQIHRIALG